MDNKKEAQKKFLKEHSARKLSDDFLGSVTGGTGGDAELTYTCRNCHSAGNMVKKTDPDGDIYYECSVCGYVTNISDQDYPEYQKWYEQTFGEPLF